MKILILGAGKMGTFLTDVLCLQHEVALYDRNPEKLRFVFNTLRLSQKEEIKEFQPELVINCVTLKYTIDTFKEIIPLTPKNCIDMFLHTQCLVLHLRHWIICVGKVPLLFQNLTIWARLFLEICTNR